MLLLYKILQESFLTLYIIQHVIIVNKIIHYTQAYIFNVLECIAIPNYNKIWTLSTPYHPIISKLPTLSTASSTTIFKSWILTKNHTQKSCSKITKAANQLAHHSILQSMFNPATVPRVKTYNSILNTH